MNYSEFADWIYKSGVLSDPWIDGEPRFNLQPCIIRNDLYNKLNKSAELIGELYDEFSEIVINNPKFLDDYFHLTEIQKLMWIESGGLWHGISRLDLFELEDNSIKMCEMNSDTPSGEGEAVMLNEFCQKYNPTLFNPNSKLKDNFLKMITIFSQGKSLENAAIIYPTEFTEDLSMIKLYENWLKEFGFDVVLSSPFNIKENNGKIYIFDKEIQLILRHYKTDWWSERSSSWLDEDVPDPNPLFKQLKSLFNAEMAENLIVINPFGAILSQNKFSMSFFYDYINLFSKNSKEIINEIVPETRRAEDINFELIDKNEWVLKSIYGCEGDEVIIGKQVTDEIWNLTIEKIDKQKWILQRFFNAKKIDDKIPNYGVYLISGIASGVFTRLSGIQTEYNSITVPTFIQK
jgi:glutathionylspermidine synthase